MGPEIFGACQGGASSGDGSASEPLHLEIVSIFKSISGAGLGRVITPDQRYVRYQGPLGPFDPDYLESGDFPADKTPVIRPFELPDTMGDYAYTSALGPFPEGLYYIEHTGIIDADITEHGASFFDGVKRFLVRIPDGATTDADIYAQYNDPWSAELSATRTGGDNGATDGVNTFMDFPGYRMRMSGMIHLNEGDSIAIVGDFAGIPEAFTLYWNRLVVRRIGDAVPMLQSGATAWAP